ncbi:DUF7269 family protein [Halomicrobium salinisoli]|uniref:DUF7269 family protein n=1 Tax=Halomicrobium salinisoli TaxID=2878391 RepID=UPI001CEFC750|nr:hypothetical protein [Halomicrobium salinisoli]
MRTRVALFGALGAAATLAAAVLLFAPDLALGLPAVEALARPFTGSGRGTALLLGSALVGLYLTWAARTAARTDSPDRDPDAFDEAVAAPPEDATARLGRAVAGDLDELVDAAADGDRGAVEAVRQRLHRVAATAHARAAGVDRDEARDAVREGRWTDDRTAAAFLADGDPDHPVWSRLLLWLDPGRERRRRIERTVAATERLAASVRTPGWDGAADGDGDSAVGGEEGIAG